MKFNKKILTTLGIGIVALGLAGCSQSNSNHKTASTIPKTSKVGKKKPSKKSNKNKDKSNKKNSNSNSNSNNKNSEAISTSKNSSKSDSTANHMSRATSVNQSSTNYKKSSVDSEGREIVDLGHGITGIEDRGAGQEYISFTLKGQKRIVHGNDVQNGQDALPKARSIVNSAFE